MLLNVKRENTYMIATYKLGHMFKLEQTAPVATKAVTKSKRDIIPRLRRLQQQSLQQPIMEK